MGEGVRPYVFVGPALVILLGVPRLSRDQHDPHELQGRFGRSWVGLDNYRFVFTDASMLAVDPEHRGWIISSRSSRSAIGLVFATLADRLRRGESVAKSLIFLPMAISFVGAAVTFRLIYSYRPEGFGSNIGLLNGIVVGVRPRTGAVARRAAVEQPASSW